MSSTLPRQGSNSHRVNFQPHLVAKTSPEERNYNMPSHLSGGQVPRRATQPRTTQEIAQAPPSAQPNQIRRTKNQMKRETANGVSRQRPAEERAPRSREADAVYQVVAPRRRSASVVSMGRTGGLNLDPVTAGMPNPSQSASAMTSVCNALFACFVGKNPKKTSVIADDILKARTDPALARKLATDLSIDNSACTDFLERLARKFPSMLTQFILVCVVRQEGDFVKPYSEVTAEQVAPCRRHDPACYVSAAVSPYIDLDGHVRCLTPAGPCGAFFVAIHQQLSTEGKPLVSFSHFSEQLLPLHGRLFRLGAMVVRHPDACHFVTITRRGPSILLLDDGKPPKVLRRSRDPRRPQDCLHYWLLIPVLLLVCELPDAPPFEPFICAVPAVDSP